MADTIWDAIAEAQGARRKREQEDLKSWQEQQRLAMDQQRGRAANRLMDEEALQMQTRRQKEAQSAQQEAYGRIQAALQQGDMASADYLSRQHFGKSIQETTQLPDNPNITRGTNGALIIPDKAPEVGPAPQNPMGPLTQEQQAQFQDQQSDYQRQLAEAEAYKQKDAEYQKQLAAAKSRPQYQAGDVQFDPMAQRVSQQSDIAEAAQMAPSIKEQLMQMAALRRGGVSKPESVFAEMGRGERADERNQNRLDLEEERRRTLLEQQGLRNEGSLDVAKERGKHVGKSRGGEPALPGGALSQKQSLPAYKAIQAEENSFKTGSNYAKLLFQKQKVDEADAALRSNNPAGTAFALESTIAAGRGGMATTAFLNLFKQHSASYGGRMDNYVQGVLSGDLGEEAKKNLYDVIQEQRNGIMQEANALKQAQSSAAFANDPEKYNVKGNYEDMHDRLWVPFGFEPIKRDPGAGRVGVLGGHRANPGAGSKPEPRSIKDKMMGSKKPMSAEERLRALKEQAQ